MGKSISTSVQLFKKFNCYINKLTPKNHLSKYSHQCKSQNQQITLYYKKKQKFHDLLPFPMAKKTITGI